MTTTDLQVRIIMKELSKHGNQERASVKAGVCRQTAAKYTSHGQRLNFFEGLKVER